VRGIAPVSDTGWFTPLAGAAPSRETRQSRVGPIRTRRENGLVFYAHRDQRRGDLNSGHRSAAARVREGAFDRGDWVVRAVRAGRRRGRENLEITTITRAEGLADEVTPEH